MSVENCLPTFVLVAPQDIVLGPLLFLLYTTELFYIFENKLIG